MTQREVIKIFLASPSDVPTERRSVKKIIEELNGHIAADQNVILELISSDRTRPGFGKDGQALVNEQIARMSEYDLFIAIMWKRIGTRTPRASSGTVEEYHRAKRSFSYRGNPEIWFYFRKPQTTFKNDDEAAQQKAVLRFRSRIQAQGLPLPYTTPSDFEQQVRMHLTQWLLDRKESKNPIPNTFRSRNKSSTIGRTRSQQQRKGDNLVGRSTSHPGSWIKLNHYFFKTVVAPIRSGNTIRVQLNVPDRDHVAALRALDPHTGYSRKQVVYVDSVDVNLLNISIVSVVPKAKSAIVHLELIEESQSRNPNFLMGDVTYGRYTADEVANIHARLVLLGEPLPQGQRWFPQLYLNYEGSRDPIEASIFPFLWKSLQTSTTAFLLKAWLQAFYYLKMTHIIDDIRFLKLGPIKKKTMQVQFQGIRNQRGILQKTSIIDIVGSCILEP